MRNFIAEINERFCCELVIFYYKFFNINQLPKFLETYLKFQ